MCPSKTPTPRPAGDDTLGRIKHLAAGWDLSHSVAPPLDADEAGAMLEPASDASDVRAPTGPTTRVRLRTSPASAVLDELEAEGEVEDALDEVSDDENTGRRTPAPLRGLLDDLADPTGEVELDDLRVATPTPDEPPSQRPAPRPAGPPPPPNARASGQVPALPALPPLPKPGALGAFGPSLGEASRASPERSAFEGVERSAFETGETVPARIATARVSERARGPESGGTSVARRRRGLLGDVRYALVAPFKAFTGARELARLRERLEFERSARSRRLAELARAAISDPKLDDEIFQVAREAIMAIEEERSHHAGFAQAAEDEARVAEEARTSALAAAEKDAARLTAEITRLEKDQLDPLEADLATRRKTFDGHKEVLGASAKTIAAIEKRLTKTMTTEPERRAEVEADLAAARAERQALLRDEPQLAARVTELEPKVEDVRKRREVLQAQHKEIREHVVAEANRLQFSAKAARDRQGAAERATRQAEIGREAELVKLGMALGRERPMALIGKLRPVDEHSAAIAVLEQSIDEVEDARRGLDRPALIRGGLILAALIGSITAIVIAALLR